MNTILTIARNDLRVFFREKGQLIGLMVIPVLFTLGVGFANSSGSGPNTVRVDVVDNDNTAYSQQFLADVREANSAIRLCPMDNDEADFCQLDENPTLDEARSLQRVSNNDTLALISIPAGFEAAVQSGEAATVTYQSNDNVTAPGYILRAVQAAAGKMGAAQVASRVGSYIVENTTGITFADEADKQTFRQQLYDSAAATVSTNPVTVAYSESQQPEGADASSTQVGFGQSIPGMGSMFVMFTVFGSLYVLIREKVNWTIQRLVMMPVTRGQILAGKILMWFLVGMLQYGVVFLIGLLVGVNFGHDLVALLLTMIIYTLSITAFSFAISTLLKTEAQANSISLLLSLMLASLGGAWWSLDVVPEFMRIIGHLSPVAWAMDSYKSLLFENGNLLTVLPNLAVLVVFTAACFGFAVWRFRYE
ncbi:MAG: ABC transporter permease [Chloroflexi bacterium]|nr:ABC transporter permease [Chloroflexota bacterium]MCC6893962.1 ABC transporter permease [Anaerolineae bacterium]